MIHTSFPRNCVVFLWPCELTRSAIYGSQNFYSHKWPTVFSRRCKKENRAILRQTCVDHCILLLKHLSNHMRFIKNRLQTLFIDQLVRSKATCSFKTLLLQAKLRKLCIHADNCAWIFLVFSPNLRKGFSQNFHRFVISCMVDHTKRGHCLVSFFIDRITPLRNYWFLTTARRFDESNQLNQTLLITKIQTKIFVSSCLWL